MEGEFEVEGEGFERVEEEDQPWVHDEEVMRMMEVERNEGETEFRQEEEGRSQYCRQEYNSRV